jgi:hypothetical protein
MLSARAIHLNCWWLAKIRDQYQDFMPRSFRYALEMSITENDKAVQYAGRAADNMGVICETRFDPSIDYQFVSADGTLVARSFIAPPLAASSVEAASVAASSSASSVEAPSVAASSVAKASVAAASVAPASVAELPAEVTPASVAVVAASSVVAPSDVGGSN